MAWSTRPSGVTRAGMGQGGGCGWADLQEAYDHWDAQLPGPMTSKGVPKGQKKKKASR